MSDLTYLERQRLEKLFQMGGGYVLNFSNRTLQEFVADAVGRDIYNEKYVYGSGSKANLLRRFWEVEPNHVVGTLVANLISVAEDLGEQDANLLSACRHIVDRLLRGAPVEELHDLSGRISSAEFDIVLRAVRGAIDANEPEAALDRLHTFATKYLRHLCHEFDLQTPRDKPLHSLMGELIKAMKASGLVKTTMAERILKSTIANLDAFNAVRNEHSLAHDNPILTYDESLLIVNNVISSMRFLQSVLENSPRGESSEALDDLPF
jgi:hypothetical protein